MLPGRAEVPFVPLRAILRFEFGLLVENTRTGDGRFESAGLRNRPFAHLAAIRPAADAESVGIRFTRRDDAVQDSDQVPVIAAAPVAAVGFHEILTVAV